MLEDRDLRLDLFALSMLALTVFLSLSLLTYDPADPLGEPPFPLSRAYQPDQLVYPPNPEVSNACGHAGALVADLLLRLVGLGAYYVVFALAALNVWLLMRKPIQAAGLRFVGWLASLVGITALLSMFLPVMPLGPVIGPGGFLGALGRTFLETHFATVGSLILLVSLTFGGLLLCTDYVLVHFVLITGTVLLNAMSTSQVARRGILGWLGRQRTHRSQKLAMTDTDVDVDIEEEEDGPVAIRIRGRRMDDLSDFGRAVDDEDEAAVEYEVDEEYSEDNGDEGEYEESEEFDEEETDDEADEERPAAAESGGGASSTATKLRVRKPPEVSERQEVMAQLEEASNQEDAQDYELPPLDILLEPDDFSFEEQRREISRKARILEKTFQDFNLEVRVVEVETGPVIAQYEVALKRGLRLSKITGLADDLAIALRVPSVRIVAPIPGKNTVGIEVPNDQRQVVRMREVMEETNGRLKKMRIPLFLGKDVSGNPLTVDLSTLPHLLIAGRTGTGKSVCLNAIISSILMTRRPDEVRMLMIDPKMVELSGYGTLPHLMHPVVTDMRKAEAILAWAVEKMEQRYELLARAGVRHVSIYNQLGEEELMERLQPETPEDRKAIPLHLPFIVIVADEMADLMMTAGKEVEQHIIRLAQKSRAVGIHLILATQKPTVDVITGLIKSNLPARIAFQVASRTDSRVVLDEMGADKLLGNGDMLFLWPGTSSLLRGQGTYLSDDEINKIVDCVSTGEQNFVRELVQMKVDEPNEGGGGGELKKRDDLYEEAVDIVIREGRGSVSLLQRNLQIGYGRAARLIDFMAEDGIVGPYNGSQAREVVISLADWQSMQSGGSTETTKEPELAKTRRSNKVLPNGDWGMRDSDGDAESPGQGVGKVVKPMKSESDEDEVEDEEGSADEFEADEDEARTDDETEDDEEEEYDSDEFEPEDYDEEKKNTTTMKNPRTPTKPTKRSTTETHSKSTNTTKKMSSRTSMAKAKLRTNEKTVARKPTTTWNTARISPR